MGQGFFEQRRNDKALRQLRTIEQLEGRDVSTFAVQGTQKFEWSNAATAVLSVFGIMFVVAAFLGYVFYPGGLLLVGGYNATKPRRTISMNCTWVTVWEHSFWSSKVTRALVTQPRSLLEVNSFVFVPGALAVDLSSNEIEALHTANAQLGLTLAPPVAVPPPPTAPNTAHVWR